MAHKSPMKKKLPEDVLERNDHDLMEAVFGKKVMKEIDKEVAKRSSDDEDNVFMK